MIDSLANAIARTELKESIAMNVKKDFGDFPTVNNVDAMAKLKLAIKQTVNALIVWITHLVSTVKSNPF